MPVSQDTLRSTFATGLRNVHAVEHQALAVLHRQIERLEHYPELAARLRRHVAETHEQIARVEAILGQLDERPSPLKDIAMTVSGDLATLSHRFAGDEVIKNSFADYMFENFEVASYTGLIVMAEEGGFASAVAPLRESLAEEQAMAQFVLDALPTVTRTFIARSVAGQAADR